MTDGHGVPNPLFPYQPSVERSGIRCRAYLDRVAAGFAQVPERLRMLANRLGQGLAEGADVRIRIVRLQPVQQFEVPRHPGVGHTGDAHRLQFLVQLEQFRMDPHV